MAIDRIDWHAYGDFPDDLPSENGGIHIGFYLTWIIENNLESEDLQEDAIDELEMIRKREMDGLAFLIQVCDEKFISDDLGDEGYAFTQHYYESENNNYFEDFERVLAQGLSSSYCVENSWDNYDKIAPVITNAYKKWKKEINN